MVEDGDRVCWKKKLIFFDLKYWKYLPVRHVLDVMHIEKNVCDSIIGTLLEIPEKNKDGIAARLDLLNMGVKTDLQPEYGERRTRLPPRPWNLLRAEKREVCNSFYGMKVPECYSSNIKNLVSLQDSRLLGLKSHDCHILMQQLLPVAIRSVLEKPARQHMIHINTAYPKFRKRTKWLQDKHNSTFIQWLLFMVQSELNEEDNHCISENLRWLAAGLNMAVSSYRSYLIKGDVRIECEPFTRGMPNVDTFDELMVVHRNHPPSTTDTTSTNGTGASGSQPAKKNTRGPCRQLKMAKVTQVTNSRINIEYDERHRAAPTAELHSSLAHDIGHVIRTHCPMKWKSWKVMPNKMRMKVLEQLSTNYNLEDLDYESLAYVNRLFAERYKQWKTYTTIFRHLMIRRSLFMTVACGSLRGEKIVGRGSAKKAQANKGNRNKKTLLHHSGSRPFFYKMDVRRRGGPNSHRSTSLPTFMFDLGMSWLSPFIRRWWRRASWFFKSPPPNFLAILHSSLWILHKMQGSDSNRDLGSDSREEARDILSRDGECPVVGT
ncbi:unnamed protein product [Prunus armeniaca]